MTKKELMEKVTTTQTHLIWASYASDQRIDYIITFLGDGYEPFISYRVITDQKVTEFATLEDAVDFCLVEK